MENLKKQYNESVKNYIIEFEKRHDVDFDGWIGETVGEVAMFGDYTFNFSEIKYVIDNDIKFEWLSDWYWFIVTYQKCYYNFNSYCKFRRDAEKKQSFNLHYSDKSFNLHSFEKSLIYMRIDSNTNN